MSNLIGKSLGRYHILEQLGQGGMAVVYKALDTQLERHVAVKVITPSREHSEKFLKRFKQEAKALAKLTHPNIVGIIDFGEEEGLPYLAMEYLAGGTLKQKLAGKPMHWQEAIKLLLPIAQALDVAHGQGIIHRDIKPSNILITGSGEPMLTDFGIAKILDVGETMDLTGTGVGVGTPEYMSPEQAQGKSVDARSDVYSLGVVLYEMVTGRKPYQADTPMAVVFKLASEPLPSPRNFMPNLPASVEQVLIKMLAKDAKNRFASMQALAQALNDLTGQVQTTAQPNFQRNRIWTWTMITLLVISISTGAWFIWNKGTPTSPRNTSIPQPSQTPTTAPIPSITIPTSIETPQEAETVSAYYDQFENPIHDGEINLDLWSTQTPGCKVAQTNKTLKFDNNSSGSGLECDIYMSKPTTFLKANQLGVFEVKAMISSDYNNKNLITQEIQYLTDDLSGDRWYALCGLIVYGGDQVQGFMRVYGGESTGNGYVKDIDLDTGFDVWHTLRLEVSPDIFEISCKVDGKLAGIYVPKIAMELAGATFRRGIEAARFKGAFASSYIDDVYFESSSIKNTVILPAAESQRTFLALEDFEDEEIQILGYSVDSNRWQIVDDGTGNKVYQVDNRDGIGTPGFAFGADEWKNYIVEYKIRYLTGNYVGPQFYYNGPNAYILNWGNSDLYLAEQTPSEWIRIVSKTLSVQLDQWYTVRLDASENMIRVYIDDNLWINEQGLKFNQGWLLMFAEAGAFAQVDDLKIWEVGH